MMLAATVWGVFPTLFGTSPNAVANLRYNMFSDFNLLIFACPIAVAYLLLKGKPRDNMATVWCGSGLILPFIFGGKTVDYLTVFGVIVTVAWMVSVGVRVKKERRRVRTKGYPSGMTAITVIAMLGISALAFSASYSLFSNSGPVIQPYESLFMGGYIPKGATVLSGLPETEYIEGFGGNVLWDPYLEHIPANEANQDLLVSCIYLENETAAYNKLRQLNVSYVIMEGGSGSSPNTLNWAGG